MAYNKAREEMKWRRWKEQEEKTLRKLGVDEAVIAEIRTMDKSEFNSERRYREHQVVPTSFTEYQEEDMGDPQIQNIQQMIEYIENEELRKLLLQTDQRTLQILVFKMMGYSVWEISEMMKLSRKAIYGRIDRLKKKIKKIIYRQGKI